MKGTFWFPIFSLLVWTISLCSGQLDPAIQESIDSLIQSEMITKGNVAGLGLAIVKDGEIIYTQGYGYQDIENSVQADSDSLFFIGSISKSFTASIAVKVLSDKFPELGQSVLDIPISQLVPGYNFTLGDRYRSENTNIRDLLSHRVGGMSQDFSLAYDSVQDSKEYALRSRYAKEMYPFRTQFLYNNIHIHMVGQIIAEISGLEYNQLLENFLADLGMTESTYVKESDDHYSMAKRAVGYYWKDGQQNRYSSELFKRFAPIIAAGGILTSANDMGKYLQFHLNKGKVGDVQVVPEEVMQWLYRISNPNNPTTWKTQPDQKVFMDVGRALGLFVGSYDGYQCISHGGYLPPFQSHLSIYPALNLGILTTANSNGFVEYPVRHDTIHFNILEMLQGQQPLAQDKFVIGPLPDFGLTLAVPSSIIKSGGSFSKYSYQKPVDTYQAIDILGHYGSGLQGELDITEELNSTGQMQPRLNFGRFGTGWLRQISNNEFFFDMDSVYIQDYYAGGLTDEAPEIQLTYNASTNSIIYREYTLETEFVRDQVLGDLPLTPWSPDSCGPENV